jgi:glycosyltransferase 2 family protein
MTLKPGRAARLIVLVVTALTCAALAHRLDERRVIAAFEEVNWGWVAFAAVINIGNSLVEAWRWSLLASALKPGVRVRSAFLAIVSGVAGGLMLPFKLGDGVKAYVFAKAERVGVAQAIGTVVADRMADLTAFAVIALGVSFTVSLPGAVGRAVHYVSGGLAGFLAVVMALAAAGRFREWLRRPGRVRLLALAGRGLDGLARFGSGIPLGRVGIAAVSSWLVRGAVVWAMMRAFHLDIPVAGALVTLVIVNIGIAVTGVPGNVGSFEIAAVGALELYGVAPEDGVSYALALHATELLPVLAIGAVLALSGAVDIGGWLGQSRLPQPETPEP